MFRKRRVGWWLLGVALGIGLIAQGGGDGDPSRAAGEPPSPAGSAGPAPTPAPPAANEPGPRTPLGVLASLPVKGRAPMTGYAREAFGPAWLDADRNGCDTRNDILGRDLVDRTHKPGTRNCLVLTGTLHDPYLGRDIAFDRTAGSSVDIDHVVALGNAWATGAARFDIRRRAAFANDPLNLLAVDLHTNRAKGAGDAATWLPPHKPFRCAYVARQIAVKAKYRLWVTPPEREAMRRVLRTCPSQGLPNDTTRAPTRVDHDIAEPSATPAPRGLAGTVSTSYANCTAVRAAGAAPIRVGDPGYGRHLDRDGDGIGCE